MLWTALVFGLMSSFHCAVMCGPILLAMGGKADNVAFLISKIIYHTGRISIYALMGGIMGLLGKGLYLAGFQQGVSIVSGVLILLFVLLPRLPGMFFRNAGLNRLSSGFKSVFSSFLQKKGLAAQFITGSINGLLPCGMVYIALVAAAAFKTPVSGMAYMALFGIGTLPLLLFISFSGHLVTFSFRNRINKLIPYTTALLGIIFILRGLSLGIPYVSPLVGAEKSCCAKGCH